MPPVALLSFPLSTQIDLAFCNKQQKGSAVRVTDLKSSGFCGSLRLKKQDPTPHTKAWHQAFRTAHNTAWSWAARVCHPSFCWLPAETAPFLYLHGSFILSTLQKQPPLGHCLPASAELPSFTQIWIASGLVNSSESPRRETGPGTESFNWLWSHS